VSLAVQAAKVTPPGTGRQSGQNWAVIECGMDIFSQFTRMSAP